MFPKDLHEEWLSVKDFVARIPIIGQVVRTLYRVASIKVSSRSFYGSEEYWKGRYSSGGSSGVGSYGKFAQFKAEIINDFVREKDVRSVIEFGCGDGNQLALAEYPHYRGFDISPEALSACEARFRSDPTKSFALMSEYDGEKADLALSLDVLYHLVENAVFERYMWRLFGSAKRFVIIYSSNTDDSLDNRAPHVRHRKFTGWIEANLSGWMLDRHIPNRYPYTGDQRQGSFSDFYIYRRVA